MDAIGARVRGLCAALKRLGEPLLLALLASRLAGEYFGERHRLPRPEATVCLFVVFSEFNKNPRLKCR